MQTDDLVRAYQGKTDEELLDLAAARGQLTPEALNVLNGELSRRRIKLDTDPAVEEHSRTNTRALPAHELSAKGFLADVLAIYRDHFWFFFRMSLFTLAISWLMNSWRLQETHALSRDFVQRPQIHLLTMLKLGFTTWGIFFLTWNVFSGLFAAISAATQQIASGNAPTLFGALTLARRRSGKWLRAAILHFLLLISLVALSGALLTLFAAFAPIHMKAPVFIAVVTLLFGAIAFLLARFALIIPAIVIDNAPVKQSFFLSDELTRGKWIILTSLLAKSIIGGYVVGMLPFWTVRWMGPQAPLPSYFHSMLVVLSISAASAVEPVMFIGFALLYLRVTAIRQSLGQTYSFQ